jgi:hypothetical protein
MDRIKTRKEATDFLQALERYVAKKVCLSRLQGDGAERLSSTTESFIQESIKRQLEELDNTFKLEQCEGEVRIRLGLLEEPINAVSRLLHDGFCTLCDVTFYLPDDRCRVPLIYRWHHGNNRCSYHIFGVEDEFATMGELGEHATTMLKDVHLA